MACVNLGRLPYSSPDAKARSAGEAWRPRVIGEPRHRSMLRNPSPVGCMKFWLVGLWDGVWDE
jgi:hypothetical protein